MILALHWRVDFANSRIIAGVPLGLTLHSNKMAGNLLLLRVRGASGL